MPRETKNAKAPPYAIRPLQVDHHTLKDVHPMMASLYFRAEALLRSPAVMQGFRKSKKKFRLMLNELSIPFDPLAGFHHVLMRPFSRTPDDGLEDAYASLGYVRKENIEDGITDIVDLATLVNVGPSIFFPRGGEAEILEGLRKPFHRYLYLRLDLSRTASPILEDLRPLLEKKHKQYKSTPMQEIKDPFERWHREYMHPTFCDISAWLKYFRCYDLRTYHGQTWGQIAHTVYGTHRLVSNAKKAVDRVEEAIKAAQANTWPPDHPSR